MITLTCSTQLGETRKAAEIGYKGGNKWLWHACELCGKERWVVIRKREPSRKHCHSCAARLRCVNRRGANNPTWKGGKSFKDGYILVWLDPDDFFYPMANKRGYVLEHRLVMAKHLGRCLQNWEIVHHKGIRYKDIKNKSDNLIDNLQLVSDDRHKQITILENKIAKLEVRVNEQGKRITLLEAENILLRREAKVLFKEGA